MRSVLFIFFFVQLVPWVTIKAQQRDSVAIYGVLDTVQVIRERIRHANEASAGARVTHIDPAVMQANRTRSLAELLSENSTIYIKSIGRRSAFNGFVSWRECLTDASELEWNQYHTTDVRDI